MHTHIHTICIILFSPYANLNVIIILNYQMEMVKLKEVSCL